MNNESHNIEWKSSWRDEYLKWIAGFANAQGGTLFIGKNDTGEVIGVNNAEKLLEDLPNKIRDILGIMADVSLIRQSDKDLIEIHVDPYPSPISYKGEYHYRSGSTKQELKGVALEQFLLKKRGRHWDGVPEPAFPIESCSEEALNLFKQKATNSGRMDSAILQDSYDVILHNLELTEPPYLKRATCLLFSDRPESYASGAWIKIGFFTSDDDLRYQDEVHGNLFKQVDQVLEILHTKYMKAYISYEGVQRVETFLFPYEALREALLNAVVHKDYSSGIPIQISVYENKIVIWNSGQLPPNWNLKQLMVKHPSCPFNPLVANAFFRAGQIESWGRGIEKIRSECNKHEIDPPAYDFEMSGLMLTFNANPAHLPVSLQGAVMKKKVEEQYRDISQCINTEEFRSAFGISSDEFRSIFGANILKTAWLIHKTPEIRAKELGVQLGVTTRTAENYLAKLRQNNRIKRIGSDKTGHWEVVNNC